MAHDTQWWKKTDKKKKCHKCGREDFCFEWQKDGIARCGYNRLCETKCYEELVHHVHKQYISRRRFFPYLFGSIIGLFIGAGGVYTSVKYLNNFVYITIVTKRQKKILTDWALSKAENVSSQTIRQMVEAACESRFPYLIMAIICAETVPKFNPGSVSSAGCIGPMQVNPKVWTGELVKQGIISNREDLFDPVLGVRAGIYILERELIKAKGNLRVATEGYVGLIHNKKDAGNYFEYIQKYLGEIYLAVHLADKREEAKDGKEENTGN